MKHSCKHKQTNTHTPLNWLSIFRDEPDNEIENIATYLMNEEKKTRKNAKPNSIERKKENRNQWNSCIT